MYYNASELARVLKRIESFLSTEFATQEERDELIDAYAVIKQKYTNAEAKERNMYYFLCSEDKEFFVDGLDRKYVAWLKLWNCPTVEVAENIIDKFLEKVYKDVDLYIKKNDND